MGCNPNPYISKTIDQLFFEIIDTLCGRFIGLTPFMVLNETTANVFDLWVDVILNDRIKKNSGDIEEWVTSNNADWH